MAKNTVINCDVLSCRNRRILIVDDEKDIALVLKKGLQYHGFTTDAFDDPRLALANFKAGQYDLVITDVKMPGMNGFDLARKVKAMNPQVKIFLMTAFEISQSELEQVLPSVKVEGLIEKPVSMRTLVSLIEEQL